MTGLDRALDEILVFNLFHSLYFKKKFCIFKSFSTQDMTCFLPRRSVNNREIGP